MKPIIILPPDTMSEADIQTLRDNDLCVVVATNPGAVKFLDPIPSAAERTKVEDAAIELSRKILDRETWRPGNAPTSRGDAARMYVDVLLTGTRLDPDPQPTQAEIEQSWYDEAHCEEIQKMAREDARAERAAKKAEQEKAKAEKATKK